VFIPGLSSLFHRSMYLFFVTVLCCFDYRSIVVLSEVWKHYASSFVFSLEKTFHQNCQSNSSLLSFCIHLRITCSGSVTNII